MAKTILLNLLFALLVSVAVAVVTYIVGIIIYYLINEIIFYGWFNFIPSPKGVMIAYAIIALIISFICSSGVAYLLYSKYYGVQNNNSSSWFEDADEFVSCGKGIAVNLGILVVGLLSWIVLACCYNYAIGEIMATENGLMPAHIVALIFLLIGIGTGMIAYFIVLCIAYNTNACDYCRLIGRVSFKLESSETKEYTEYRTKTSREKVGSLYSDDIELAEIYGDITKTQSRNVQETSHRYIGKCNHCGHVNHRTVLESISDLWS